LPLPRLPGRPQNPQTGRVLRRAVQDQSGRGSAPGAAVRSHKTRPRFGQRSRRSGNRSWRWAFPTSVELSRMRTKLTAATRPMRSEESSQLPSRGAESHRMKPLKILFSISLLAMNAIGCLDLYRAPLCDSPDADPATCAGPRPAADRADGSVDRPSSTLNPDGATAPGNGLPVEPVMDPGCEPGFHKCDNTCRDSKQVETCGMACAPCPQIEGGTTTCDGSRCGVRCPDGQKACDDKCIDAGAPCGGCPDGKNACNGLCVSATETTACGPSCEVCPTSSNGKTACDGSKCILSCNEGFHLCQGKCVTNTDANACGASCTACTAPAGGTATCVGGQCAFDCPNGRKCNDVCLAPGQPCANSCPVPGEKLCKGMCYTDGTLPSETCGNGSDDDCDGKIDCADSDCGEGTNCGSGRVCQQSKCIVPCGNGPGQTCCEGTTMDCSNNCGDPGKRTCNSGAWGACSKANTCCGDRSCTDKCGKQQTKPCNGTTLGACPQSSCDGGLNQPCKAGNVCNTADLACQRQTCVKCGGQGQPCCGPRANSLAGVGQRCRGKTVCVQGDAPYIGNPELEDRCVPCGGDNQECCISGSGEVSCDLAANVCAHTDQKYPGNCQL
jgi:hypothetical protein